MFVKKTVAQKIQELEQSSKGIVDIFTSTIHDLQNVNAVAQAHHEDHEATIAQLKAEQEALASITSNNQKVIDKISKIFE
jgi:septal ring factor EnvC (AmiA/AmiB activator)